jgi:hypothetical protein
VILLNSTDKICCIIQRKLTHETDLLISALQFVRRWTLGELLAARNHELYGHNYPVRSLAAGECETLVSADAGGEIAVWRL